MALTTGVPQVNAKRATYRQRRMGPAPFASLEDLSDDQDSPPPSGGGGGGSGGGSGGGKLPGIREDPQPSSSLHTPSTPRIDISRASSSSHHDSNNSSPERELFAGEVPCKLGLGFKEDAADLRSSTEELDLGDDDPVGCEERPRSRRGSARSARALGIKQEAGGRPRGGSLSKYELDAAAAASAHERKDSLSIVSTGRTSRLSSVGSAASGASSAASHLSVASSGGGRSPSPHKMLLETSFCGSKPLLAQPSIELDELPPSSKEAIAQVDGSMLGAAACGDGSRPASRRDGPPLLLPNVSPVVSPAERELLAAKERALAEEVRRTHPALSTLCPSYSCSVVRELESRRAEKPAAPASLSLPVSPPPTGAAPSRTPSASPKPSRRPQRGALRDADSRTPSPGSVSRKSSFASLFRRGGGGGSSGGGETTPSTVVSPESPTGSTGVRRNKSGSSFSTILGDGFRERSRSRSKSRERQQPPQQQDGKPRSKGVFSALFKKKDRKKAGHAEQPSPGDLPSPESRVPQQAAEPLATVEFKFDSEAEAPAPAAAASQPPAAAVVHRPERRGSGGGGGGAGAEEAQAHRRAASNKRRAMHEAQLLPAECQGLADVIAGSGLDRLASISVTYLFARRGGTRISPPPPPPHKKSQQQQQQQQAEERERDAGSERPPAEPPRQQRTPFRSEREQEERLSELRKLKPRRPPEEGQPQQQQHERQGLVLQDSFEGELPYVPTTLPQERSVAVPILPVRQRSAAEVRTCPIERPRSTTPINPALLDEYVQHEAPAPPPPPAEKMRIQLPREETARFLNYEPPSKLYGHLRRHGVSLTEGALCSRTPSGRSWFEFAEQGAGLQSPREGRKPSLSASSPSPPPPPLPPRANPPPPPPPPPQPAAPAARQWINFEEIPEKRKPPRRIQTLPASTAGPPVVYSYVDPEECECECHETSGGKGRSHSAASTSKKKKEKDKDKEKERDKEKDREKIKSDERTRSRSRSRSHSRSQEVVAGDGKTANVNKEQRQMAPTSSPTAEAHHHHHHHQQQQQQQQQPSASSTGDRLEVTDVADRNSYLSDSSYEFPNSYSIDTSDYSDGLKPMKPFGMDLDVTSNRSSIISQQDETQSPEVGSPNGNETKHRQ
ncbi:serine/arginine repetitive matrix protein 1 [Schistocerca serialis cubense]|uniref:serine/arginine repetitive matrix protein 1 n=1 Tax=Schistocerca serialis cubense TaxID=2023355 RepID=UPI00214EF301|nr:serine/arginine repetitive matrix protein 1 [Schistocerca serialis cubense]